MIDKYAHGWLEIQSSDDLNTAPILFMDLVMFRWSAVNEQVPQIALIDTPSTTLTVISFTKNAQKSNLQPGEQL